MKYFAVITLLMLGLSVIFSTTTLATSGTYAALGDSVAAGAGLSTTDPICDRSPDAYPSSVAVSTGLALSHYACTGAKADEGIYSKQDTPLATLPAQLDQAYENSSPELITLTIGANDSRWTQFIRQCYYTRCGFGIDTARFNTYLVDLKLELNVIMAKIHRLSDGDPPQVITTGYYSPISITSCTDTEGITTEEARWLSERVNRLNSTISNTTSKYSYAQFAPVDFTGHELCSENSWIQGLSERHPFHPTQSGQQAIASSVVAHYRDELSTPPASETSSYRERTLSWYERLFH